MNTTPNPIRVLFVCMGNICRSPAAECLFQHYVEKQGWEDRILTDSAGTIGFHAGSPPDQRMQEAGRKRGYVLQGQSRQIQPEDLETFDLVITMDDENLRNVRQLDPMEQFLDRIIPLCSFCGNFSETEVPDPYYGGSGGFDHVIDLIEDALPELFLRSQELWKKGQA